MWILIINALLFQYDRKTLQRKEGTTKEILISENSCCAAAAETFTESEVWKRVVLVRMQTVLPLSADLIPADTSRV